MADNYIKQGLICFLEKLKEQGCIKCAEIRGYDTAIPDSLVYASVEGTGIGEDSKGIVRPDCKTRFCWNYRICITAPMNRKKCPDMESYAEIIFCKLFDADLLEECGLSCAKIEILDILIGTIGRSAQSASRRVSVFLKICGCEPKYDCLESE